MTGFDGLLEHVRACAAESDDLLGQSLQDMRHQALVARKPFIVLMTEPSRDVGARRLEHVLAEGVGFRGGQIAVPVDLNTLARGRRHLIHITSYTARTGGNRERVLGARCQVLVLGAGCMLIAES
jgi:hypothetical protein